MGKTMSRFDEEPDGDLHGECVNEIRSQAARIAELESALLRVARLVEDLKLPCSDNPESPQAIRNGHYMSIALIAREALKETP
jgi:hypothetical protein